MTVSNQSHPPSKLLNDVRSRKRLWAAWRRVRESALVSASGHTRAEAEEIEGDPARVIIRLQRQLRDGRFSFAGQKGYTKPRPGKRPRGIVSSPVQTRIVQRALLDVIQERGKDRLGRLPMLAATATSVGGIPGRGVNDAVDLIQAALSSGAEWFIRSDIKEFFTRVQVQPLVDLVATETGDQRFADFFQQALSIDLENAVELKRRGLLDLFPDGETGVPQGSPLSALAANLTLAEFDRVMNEGEVLCVRYIDDFVVLGHSEKAVWAAWKRGKAVLKRLGLEPWSPHEGTEKAATGKTNSGFEFLSYRFSQDGIGIAAAAMRKFKERVMADLAGMATDFGNGAGEVRTNERRIIQDLKALDDRIRGWANSFQRVDRGLELEQLDKIIGREVRRLFSTMALRSKSLEPVQKLMRALGISTLHDIHLSRRRRESPDR